MSGSGLKQRLAAILAADVAGYSRLMAADDRATVAALDAARKAFRTQIESNQGRVIDMAGDSVLAVFETATGAVTAALSIQKELNLTGENSPEDRRMRFRIGVHLGDVIEKADGTVYGDGVNIAARLEGLAEPGGITVSDSVRNAVRGKVNATFEDRGENTVKNIAEPVRAYAVRAGSGAGVKPVPAAGNMGLPLPDKLAIAVLPFTNMSENKDNAFFADGMHEELLTQLALLGEMKVVSRTSVMEYRDSTKHIRQIAAELGVRSLVEGSVRRAGNRVRVTAQLIDAASDTHAWGRSFDRDLTDVFAIQSELATEIARALKVSLTPSDQARLAKKPTENLAAYDLLLRHQELVNRFKGTFRSISAVNERIAPLSKAVELDPTFALAWARLGAEHARAYDFGIDRSSSRLAQARQAIERAQALAPDDLEVQIEEGTFYQYGANDYTRAAQTLENVLRVAPNNVDARLQLAFLRKTELNWAEYAADLEKVLAIDARNVGALAAYADLLRDFRHYDRALAVQQQLINIRPDDLDLQARYQQIEHSKSDSWDSFDKWRPTLPPSAERTLLRVWILDLDRVIARRDLDGASRLCDAVPQEFLQAEEWGKLFASEMRALVFLAMGERPRAMDTARTVLGQATAKLRSRPDDRGLLWLSYYSRAILGEREAALAEHRRAHTLALASKNLLRAKDVYRDLAGLHALLGDREQALREISRQLMLPEPWAFYYRMDPAFCSLWDDPKFLAIVNDPANNAPLPFDLGRSAAIVK